VFEIPNGNMRGKEKSVFSQCGLHESGAAFEIGFLASPIDHPGRLFKLDLMMIEIPQTVEGLPFRVDANNLVARCLARSSNDLNRGGRCEYPAWESVVVAQRMQRSEDANRFLRCSSSLASST
jgi:hypothetical protein